MSTKKFWIMVQGGQTSEPYTRFLPEGYATIADAERAVECFHAARAADGWRHNHLPHTTKQWLEHDDHPLFMYVFVVSLVVPAYMMRKPALEALLRQHIAEQGKGLIERTFERYVKLQQARKTAS